MNAIDSVGSNGAVRRMFGRPSAQKASKTGQGAALHAAPCFYKQNGLKERDRYRGNFDFL